MLDNSSSNSFALNQYSTLAHDILAKYAQAQPQWALLPVEHHGKSPLRDAWQTRRFSAADFPADANIGLNLGLSGVADVDLDCPEAVELAPLFLPSTPARFGRASSRDSHWLYAVETSESRKPLKDPTRTENATLLELRIGKHQTVLPGSIHPSGERIEWSDGAFAPKPAGVAHGDLERCCRRLAAAVLVGRHASDSYAPVVQTIIDGATPTRAALAGLDPRVIDKVLEWCGSAERAELLAPRPSPSSDERPGPNDVPDPSKFGDSDSHKRWKYVEPSERQDTSQDAKIVERAASVTLRLGNDTSGGWLGFLRGLRFTAARAYAILQDVNARTEQPMPERELYRRCRQVFWTNSATDVVPCTYGKTKLKARLISDLAKRGEDMPGDAAAQVAEAIKAIEAIAAATTDPPPDSPGGSILTAASAWLDETGHRWDTASARWLRYDGKVWAPAPEAGASFFEFCKANTPASIQNKFSSALRSAQERSAIAGEMLDANPDLLGFPNGTLDLRTGELRPHAPEDMITRLAGADFDPAATDPSFAAFIDKLACGDAEWATFAGAAAGVTLFAAGRAKVIFDATGDASSGKTSFLKLLAALGGDYARWADPSTFMVKQRGGNHSDDRANLAGGRVVIADELPKRGAFDIAYVNRLSGGGVMTDSRKHGRTFTWTPFLTLWVAGEAQPDADPTVQGFWNRLHPLPFKAKLTPAPGWFERTVTPAFLRAAVAWAWKGYLAWRATGALPECKAVDEAREEYRETQSCSAREFASESVTYNAGQFTSFNDLNTAYVNWCHQRRIQTQHIKQQRELISAVIALAPESVNVKRTRDSKRGTRPRGLVGVSLATGRGFTSSAQTVGLA